MKVSFRKFIFLALRYFRKLKVVPKFEICCNFWNHLMAILSNKRTAHWSILFTSCAVNFSFFYSCFFFLHCNFVMCHHWDLLYRLLQVFKLFLCFLLKQAFYTNPTFGILIKGPGPDARIVYIDGAFDLFHAGHVEVHHCFISPPQAHRQWTLVVKNTKRLLRMSIYDSLLYSSLFHLEFCNIHSSFMTLQI